MLKEREIKLSFRRRLNTLLTSETSGVFQQAWNVYNEIQYRNALAGTFPPTFPFVYLLDTYLPAMGMRLDVMQPIIALEVDAYTRRPFEVGNRSGRYVEMAFQILGQDRGQRDDLGSFIIDYLGDSISIRTFSNASDTTGTEVEVAQLVPLNNNGDTFIKEDMFTARQSSLADDVELGGMLLGWTRLKCGIVCKV